MLFQHPANARASVTSGELCPPRISLQVVIEAPGTDGVVRKISHVLWVNKYAVVSHIDIGGFNPGFHEQTELYGCAASIATP
jgi:hypothetical protein